MKLKQRVSLCILLLVVFSFGLSAAEAPRATVLAAARAGLSSYLPLILTPEEMAIGKAKLGFGFQEYTIDPARLTGEPGVPLWEKVRPTGAWRFVVQIGGRPVALLTVDVMDGKWQAVGIGAVQLAQEVQSVLASWPQESGFQYRFIRIFQAQADFMEVSKGTEEPRYAPLIAARVSLQINALETGPNQRLFQSEIAEPLREIVLNVMEKNEQNSMNQNTEK